MAGKDTMEFTDANFDSEVINSKTPVLVDFWAEWCMPCKALGPTIDELATEYSGKIKVGKLDTDGNREVSAKYQITAIPTVILFKDGKPTEKFIGLKSKKEFKAKLDPIAG